MLRKTNNTFLVFHILMVLFISLSLLLSVKFQGFERWIGKITGENSVFEIAIFFLLLMISTFAMMISFNNQREKAFTRPRRQFIAFIAICFYLKAMQEVRWSQLITVKSITGESGSLKGIVDLNFIIADEKINVMIHLIILVCFILLPLAIHYRPAFFRKNPSIKDKTIIYLPSVHSILMFGFACSLQTLINLLTKFDHFVLLLVFISIAGLMTYKRKLRSVSNMFHLILVSGSWLLIWIYSEKIRVDTDHHHLWQFVVVYAFFYWF